MTHTKTLTSLAGLLLLAFAGGATAAEHMVTQKNKACPRSSACRVTMVGVYLSSGSITSGDRPSSLYQR